MSVQDDIQKSIAQNELYAIGETTPLEWQQAFDSYLELSKQNNAQAQFNLGYMYARGDLMERDMGKAFEWYQKAADNNDPRAHYNLSKMYEVGEFVLTNSIKAKEHMDRAIELGDDRAKIKQALAAAKAALKKGDRDKARPLFASIAANSKEAEMGVIACDAIFKSIYTTRIIYTYHASGSGNKKKFWKWGVSVKTEVDLTMSNQSAHSWQVMVKAEIRDADGMVSISTIGDALKAHETQSNIIEPKDYGEAYVCGVTVYSDREGSADKPVFSFRFADVPVLPDEEETKKLPHKIRMAQNALEQHNKTAKPSACFVLTACYGSYDAPTVRVFRQFRDNHLAQYTWGRAFIAWYYTHGPRFADAIENKPRIKAMFRAVFNQMAKILPR